mmetsp:Transcript_36974/g.79845  ORF Transcript_36974/g.79845 Transcript_36974/m.79845 type:complete len:137 (+) Transcript_36974:28-438(+)
MEQNNMAYYTDAENGSPNYDGDYHHYHIPGNDGNRDDEDDTDDRGNDNSHSPSAELPFLDVTPSQMDAMDEFIKSPSQDKWLKLVEAMRRVREEQEFGNATVGALTPPRGSSSRLKSSRSPRKSSRSSSRSPMRSH